MPSRLAGLRQGSPEIGADTEGEGGIGTGKQGVVRYMCLTLMWTIQVTSRISCSEGLRAISEGIAR